MMRKSADDGLQRLEACSELGLTAVAVTVAIILYVVSFYLQVVSVNLQLKMIHMQKVRIIRNFHSNSATRPTKIPFQLTGATQWCDFLPGFSKWQPAGATCGTLQITGIFVVSWF